MAAIRKEQVLRSRERCKSLRQFVKEAWHVLEPGTTFLPNWHIDAICDHLEAVTRGEMLRFICNMPPGMLKSILISVMWQAWEWGPMGLAHNRFLTSSWSDAYVKRDTRRTRDLILSDWYQSRWGANAPKKTDQKKRVILTRFGEASFENTRKGFREGKPFGSLTSGRGDRLVIDDPHSTETAESDAERKSTTRIFRESATTRINDPKKSAIVIVMQRLHTEDVTGVAEQLEQGYVVLRLPMEFEVEDRCTTPVGFVDPRTEEGELLFPARMGPAEVKRDKKAMGSHATAGQFQQRPVPRGGGLFKREYFADKIKKAAPYGTVWVRRWDLAATKKERAARTAGVKMGRAPDGTFWVGHSIIEQEEGAAVRRIIKTTAQTDGRLIPIYLPQDPGQAGKVQAQDFIANLAGWEVHAEPETGDKYTRAEPFAAQCEGGNVYIVEGSWNEAYIDELVQFPGGKFADQVDASSGAFGALVQMPDTSTVVTPLRGNR
jgi:predicted phage terminase large subunit-like protein